MAAQHIFIISNIGIGKMVITKDLTDAPNAYDSQTNYALYCTHTTRLCCIPPLWVGGGGGGAELFMCPYPVTVQAHPL